MIKSNPAVSPKDTLGILQQEYYEWVSKQVGNLKIWMEKSVTGKDSVNLSFKTNSGKTFTVLCPPNYPKEAGNFLLEPSEGLQFWCQTVNEYLLDDDQGVNASLARVLDEILQFHKSILETVTFPLEKKENEAESEVTHVSEDELLCAPGETSKDNEVIYVSEDEMSYAPVETSKDNDVIYVSDDEKLCTLDRTSKSVHGDEKIITKGEKRLLEDLDEWSVKNNFYFTLKKKFKSNDGSIHFDFATPSKEDFTLLCPPLYPTDNTFMVFSDHATQLWTQQLNEFLLCETSKRSSLPEALDEAKSLYITYHDAAGDTCVKQPLVDPDVIKNLEVELETIRRSDIRGISVKLNNRDLSRWLISLSEFSPNSSLSKDLATLKNKFFYDDIQLELHIDLNVHPYYPPTLKVIRPRLQKDSILSVLKIDDLRLSKWDPESKLSSILLDIRYFFENHVQVDLNSERNNFMLYAEGSYSDIENHLFRLASVCEIKCRSDFACDENNQSSLSNEASKSSSSSSSNSGRSKKKNNFPKGVGYGHSSGTGYSRSVDKSADLNTPDPLAYRVRDEQLAVILRNIIENLKQRRVIAQSETSTVTDHYYQLLESSCLIPFLESELRAVSVLEIDKHMPIYRCVTDVICEIAAHDDLIPLLWQLPQQSVSLYSLTKTLLTKADTLLKQIKKGPKPTVSSNCGSESSIEEEFSLSIRNMSEIVATALSRKKLLKLEEPSCSGEPPPKIGAAKNTGNSFGLNEMYIKELKKLQFGEHNMKTAGVARHSFISEFKMNSNVNPKLIKRMSQDFGELSASLPLSTESAIFIRVDDTNLTLLRALIIGPQGTPYSGGCFLFDIYCPSNYPAVPPKVKFLTTGGGKVRFNPNLYQCGKVCLSLLGTWNGEQWNPQSSTLLQVLISIQSLIFVAEPYFNEPGYEHYMGTVQGTASSKQYNDDIIINTIQHAMISQILHPTKDFEEVIKTHFWLRKDQILQDLETRLHSKFSKPLDNAIKNLHNTFKKMKR